MQGTLYARAASILSEDAMVEFERIQAVTTWRSTAWLWPTRFLPMYKALARPVPLDIDEQDRAGFDISSVVQVVAGVRSLLSKQV